MRTGMERGGPEPGLVSPEDTILAQTTNVCSNRTIVTDFSVKAPRN